MANQLNFIYNFSSIEDLPSDIGTLIRMYVGDRKFAKPTERCSCKDNCGLSCNKCCACKFALTNALINAIYLGPDETNMKFFERWQKCRLL